MKFIKILFKKIILKFKFKTMYIKNSQLIHSEKMSENMNDEFI